MRQLPEVLQATYSLDPVVVQVQDAHCVAAIQVSDVADATPLQVQVC